MRRNGMWLGLLALVAMAGNASAITTDGNWNDWFSYGGTTNSDWNQSSAAGAFPKPNFRPGNDSDRNSS